MKIKPLNGHLLIQKDTSQDVTEHGIVTSQIEGHRTESRAIRGLVVEIPSDASEWVESENGLKRTDMKIKVGDKVLVKKWDNHLANIEGIEYLLVQYKDILGRLEDQ